MKNRVLPIWIGILIFIVAFLFGVISKFLYKPSWMKEYSVKWSDEIGVRITDIPYGEGKLNKFDLYLPKDSSKDNYGLVVYIHAGGFTSGDKAGDEEMLSWLCSKGYVAAGINYSLRSDSNNVSVLLESNEIKSAIPVVIEEASRNGYNIDKMTVAGGSAGHALAMIYAYRDSGTSPVPVVFTFGAVGPSSFYVEDWGIFGLGMDSDESRAAGAGLFSVMSGEVITPEEIKNGSYLEKVKAISASDWVSQNPIPTVVAYGKCDRVQPFEASIRLETALKENNVDYKYFVLPHSGHGLQNDYKIYREWMKTVEEYLDKYMKVE